jgi:hypothetical protein
MQIAKVRSILWLIGGIAAAGAVVAIVAVAYLPVGSSGDAIAQTSTLNLGQREAHGPTTLPLASFASAWQAELRRSLVDAPASLASISDAPAKSAEVAVRLIGTIVDGQHPRGIFITGLATVEMKSVGDTVGSAKVLAIDDNSATLATEAGNITLHREKKPFDPSGESYSATAPADSKDASE